jgi:hypothetical protein
MMLAAGNAALGRPDTPSTAGPEQPDVPPNWLRGYASFEYATPRNEPDLGRCASWTGRFGGASAPCADFARYVLSGYVEAQPFGLTPLSRVLIFSSPRFYFGNNVPQFSYTNAFTPIAVENLFGLGIELPRNLDFRVVHHSIDWMGRYTNHLGQADVGVGTYGNYTTLGVRWHFGGTHGSQPVAPSERTFSPPNWLRGYASFEYALPHDEVDLGRCASWAGQYGGANAPCADLARYVLGGYVEAQPLGRSLLRRVFIFASPRSYFGNSVPQVSYTNAFTPIAVEILFGIGVELPRNLDLRVVQHSVDWMGRYTNSLGPADLGFTGPYGGYSTIGVRWHFGSTHELQ